MNRRDSSTLSKQVSGSIPKRTIWRVFRGFAMNHLPWVVVLCVLLVLTVVFWLNDGFNATVIDAWTIASSGDQARIRAYLKEWGAWGPVVSVLLMLLQGIFAPIPASVIQLSNGVVFGVFWGAVLNLIGQMAGATAAFYIARSLGRQSAERLAGKFHKQEFVANWLHQWGAKALFLIRAIPGMPSDFTSYLLGLSRMPARTYFTVSLIGYIPQSFAYSWLGDYATEWFWWIVLGGLGVSLVIGGVVWLVRKIMHRMPVPQRAVSVEQDC